MTPIAVFSPRFERQANQLVYKPFPRYPTWKLAYDLSDLYDALGLLGASLIDTQSDVSQLQTDVATAQATADAALAAAGSAANLYPNSQFWLPHCFKRVSADFAPPVVNSASYLNSYSLMAGLNAECSVDFVIHAGNYTVHMLYLKSVLSGDVTAFLDGVSLGAVAGYNATSVAATWSWIANNVASGKHTLSLKITGKQPSSTDYQFFCSALYMRING